MTISVRKYINKYWCPIKLKKCILVSPTPPQYCNSAAMGKSNHYRLTLCPTNLYFLILLPGKITIFAHSYIFI